MSFLSVMQEIVMTSSVKLARFFSAILLAALMGCASASKPVLKQQTGNAGESILPHEDDKAITARVKEAILREPSLQPESIGVETVEGVVRLTGAVSSIIVMEKAVEVAGKVPGVKAVKDEMQFRWQY